MILTLMTTDVQFQEILDCEETGKLGKNDKRQTFDFQN